MITLLTPTGFRPQAWNICKFLMNRQTFKGPIKWLIAYDCPTPPDLKNINSNIQAQLVPGPKQWREGINTQRLNMDVLIQKVDRCDYVFVVEDDDWYAPEYIEHCIWLMQKYDAVGEINNKYYHLPSQHYRPWRNTEHASLCSTAFKYKVLPYLDRAVNSGELFFDIMIWRFIRREQVSAIMYEGHPNGRPCMNVGLKGLPGRMGIGHGHTANRVPEGFTPDTGLATLKSWIGEADIELYKGMGLWTPSPSAR